MPAQPEKEDLATQEKPISQPEQQEQISQPEQEKPISQPKQEDEGVQEESIS